MQGNRDDDRARTKQQPRLERERALVVQELLPPPVDDQFRQDDRRVVVRILRSHLVEESEQRPRDLAVGRVDDGELDVELAPYTEPFPVGHEKGWLIFVAR